MTIELLHVGFDHFVAVDRIVAVCPRGTPPPRRTRLLIEEAEKKGLLIDTTRGRKTKAVLVMDSGHIVLTSIAPETVAARLTAGGRPRGRLQ